jgi:hypothetical protein
VAGKNNEMFHSYAPPLPAKQTGGKKGGNHKHGAQGSKLNGQPSLLVWQIDEDDDKVSKYKRDKSLGILCQQFIGLFVTWRRVISLE